MRTLLEPAPNLKACVVVPARNEEDLVGQCIQALADQTSVAPDEYEVILVLDQCTDATEQQAREISRRAPHLKLHFVDGPGEGAGHARRVGMEVACDRLLTLGRETGLIASTDADTVVAPDWLAAQFECLEQGARAIGGRIELASDGEIPENVAGWRSARGVRRHMDLLSETAANGGGPDYLEHWQFSGASLALTAEVYREVGGLEPHAALEDEHLERILHQRSISIDRPLSVKVTTSARLIGRAERGLARDLSLATWFERNTYEASKLNFADLAFEKRPTVSAVVIAEADSVELRRTTEAVVAALQSELLDEALILCAGPRISGLPTELSVLETGQLMTGFGPVRGYGDSMWRAISATNAETIVFLEPGTGVTSVESLLEPLLGDEELDLVKGFGDSPGYLTELVARPLVNLHRPELAGMIDPLSKTFAARRNLLEKLSFPVGEGATLSILLDAAEIAGTDALAQVALGEDFVPHTASPSAATAYQIQAAAIMRTSQKTLVPGPLSLPAQKGLQTLRVPTEERPPLTSLDLPNAGPKQKVR